MDGLIGARVLVSGASRGIGRAIALGLADAGCDVVGVARSLDALEALGEEVATTGRSFLPLELDLAEVGSIAGAVDRAWAWRGGLDALVNVAGLIIRTGPLEVTPEEWDSVFAVNVRGTFFLTQAVGARMLEGDGGSIVTVTSLAGEVVTRAAISYQTSKAALIQLTRALAVHWAPKVRVNAVAPGYIRTDLNAAWLEDAENRAYVVGRAPLARVGEPEDVVGAVRFLASPAAAYVTGQNLRVDGGWSARSPRPRLRVGRARPRSRRAAAAAARRAAPAQRPRAQRAGAARSRRAGRASGRSAACLPARARPACCGRRSGSGIRSIRPAARSRSSRFVMAPDEMRSEL